MKKHDALRLMLTGDSLRKLLRKKGTNKHRVAKATGVSYMALYNWERQRSVPRDEQLLVVAGHLGLIEAPAAQAEEKKGGQDDGTKEG